MHLPRPLFAAVAAVAALALPASAPAAPAGALDTSWSGDGLATADFGPGLATASEAVRYPDGRLLLAGGSNDVTDRWALARFMPDGSPDQSFGDEGRVSMAVGASATLAGVALLPDGRILVGGSARLAGESDADAVTLRLLADGSPDVTNGADGNVAGLRAFSVTPQSIEAIAAMVMDGNRPILAGTVILPNEDSDTLVVRLTEDGALHPTDAFRIRAVSMTVPETVTAAAFANQRLTVTGFLLEPNHKGFASRSIVSQASGPDGAFGTSGVAYFGPGTTETDPKTVTVLPDGRVRAAGVEASREVVYGLTAEGDPDPDFGTAGRLVPPGGFTGSNIRGIAQGPGGTLVTAGAQATSNVSAYGVVRRLRADGSPDPSFSGDGRVTLESLSPLSAFGPAIVEPDGDILAAGTTGPALDRLDFAAVRLNGTDKPDPPAPPAAGGGGGAPAAPAAPAAPPATAPRSTPPAAPKKARAADVIALPAAKRCVSRRRLTLTLRAPRGGRIVSASVRVGRAKAKRLAGAKLRGAAVSLRGLPRGTVKVSVTAKLASGETLTLTRSYKTCAPRKRRA